MSIKDNIEEIKEGIKEAALKSGRDPEEILLLAVTKLHEADEMNEAIRAGVTDIGENKVQEILRKFDSVDPVRWHLIGHLQTNKVNKVIDKVVMIHSLDSFHLAEEIEKRAAARDITVDVLIQIDIGDEDTKFGAAKGEVDTLIEKVAASCPHIMIKGLMCVAPMADDPEEARPYFAEMKKIYDSYREGVKGKGIEGEERIDMQFLSMGMTNDYKIAIEEGSNLVRVGTAIFGHRDYRKEEK